MPSCSPSAATKAHDLTLQLDGALGRINARSYAHLAPTRAALSTMTITAASNVKRVCKDSMQIALSLVDGDGPLSASAEGKRKRKKAAVFYNQVTIRHGTKSVKVFNNGSMHVTGCTTPGQFLGVAAAVCALMGDTAGLVPENGDAEVRVVDFEVQMINLNFGAGRQLYLQGLCDACASLGYTASYDADVYPGLNLKLPVAGQPGQRVTVLVFRSGKIIITGAKTAAQLEEAHGVITGVLDTAKPW